MAGRVRYRDWKRQAYLSWEESVEIRGDKYRSLSQITRCPVQVFLGTQAPPSRSASSFAGAARASKGRVNLKSSGDEDVMGKEGGGTRITRSTPPPPVPWFLA